MYIPYVGQLQYQEEENEKKETLRNYMNVVVPLPPDDPYNFSVIETAAEEFELDVHF